MSKSDLNVVTLIGRLTADPKSDTLPTGTVKASFSIANNYYNPNNPDAVNFIDLVAFGKLADVCLQYLTKGKQVAVQGELRQNRWKNKEGETRSRVEVIINNMQMLGGRNDAQSGGGYDTGGYAPSGQAEQPQPQSAPSTTPHDMGDDGDVPF